MSRRSKQMVIHLRPYQRLALYHLRRGLEAGAWRQYVDLPTGTGKSTIAAAFAAQRLGQTQGRVLAMVHRQDLALQLAETLSQEELEVGLLMEGSHTLHTLVVVATVQSLTPEATQDLLAANATPILTVLIDEAHHAVPGSVYERVLAAIEHAAGGQPVATVGLTATPYRSDERSMLSLLPVCAFARTIPEMVQEGWLAALTWKPVLVDLDLSEVATTRQSGELDYAETNLAGHLLREAITARLVKHAASLIEQRPTLVFATNVQRAARPFVPLGSPQPSSPDAAAGGSGTNCLPTGSVAPSGWSATAPCSPRATTFPASRPWSSRGPRSRPACTCRCSAGVCAGPRGRATAW